MVLKRCWYQTPGIIFSRRGHGFTTEEDNRVATGDNRERCKNGQCIRNPIVCRRGRTGRSGAGGSQIVAHEKSSRDDLLLRLRRHPSDKIAPPARRHGTCRAGPYYARLGSPAESRFQTSASFIVILDGTVHSLVRSIFVTGSSLVHGDWSGRGDSSRRLIGTRELQSYCSRTHRLCIIARSFMVQHNHSFG